LPEAACSLELHPQRTSKGAGGLGAEDNY